MKQKIEYPVVNMDEVGKRIKRLRKEQHLKVTDISDQMGFESPQAVYKWQRGECLPETVNLIVLSRMLGTTVEGIILGDEMVPSRFFYKLVLAYENNSLKYQFDTLQKAFNNNYYFFVKY